MVTTTPLKTWEICQGINELLGWEAYDIEALKQRDKINIMDFSKTAAWQWPIRDYQLEGMNFMHSHKRAMNHDDPGLGKTAQAAFAAEPPVLIICPNYLVSQWFDWLAGRDEKSREMHDGEIVKNVKGKIRRVRGNFDKKETVLELQRTDPAQWVIINQEMVNTHRDILMDLHFRTVIIDEAHHFKNHTADRGRAAVLLCETAPFVYELTATPIWKEPDDLYNQLRILHPDLFASYNKFVELFCVYDDSAYGRKVLGMKKDMIPELDELLRTVAIRRDYTKAGRFLPKVIDKYIKVEFPPKLRKAYDDLVDDYRLQLEGESFMIDNFSQMLNTLRQLTTFPGKFDAVKHVIEDNPGKVVIFTWYKDSAYEAAKQFGGIAITGDIKDPVERRRLAIDPDNKVICATISSLAEGVDISDARTVVFFEEHWPPGANKQALSRVRRDRNDNGTDRSPIVVYYVHVRKTIDEHIHSVSMRRSATIRELIREAVGLD